MTPQLQVEEDVNRLLYTLAEAAANEERDVDDPDISGVGLDRSDVAALRRVLSALETRTEALKWYADPKNNGEQEFVEIMDSASVSTPKWRPIDDDQGDVARGALGEEARHG